MKTKEICVIALGLSLTVGEITKAGIVFSNVLIGELGKVKVTETDGGSAVSYDLDVITMEAGFSVSAFAVSNGGGGTQLSITEQGWEGVLLKQPTWDGGTQIQGSNSSVNFNTANLGSYSALFGSDASVSVFYLDDMASPITMSQNIGAAFIFHGNPASQFVAIGANGALLDASSVPEPSAFLLLGLLGCLASGRRWLVARRSENAEV